MKKAILTLILAAVLCIPGCGQEKKPSVSTTKEVDQFANDMKEKTGDSVISPSESVTRAISKKWNVIENDDVYVLETDGTGSKNGEEFTFECGFDEENHITLRIQLDQDQEELYAITTDTTGYGINLASLNGGKDISLLPADLEFLDMADERAAGILGEWADESGNGYVFEKDGKMKIKGSDGDTKGTYSVVKNAEGKLLLNLVVSGGTLEFEYTLNDGNTEMELISPGTDTIHHWTKQQELFYKV